MANLKWVDRIGETKEINGIEFTIVEVEPKGTGLIVQDNKINELHETTRSTWRNGKLANVLREIKKVTMVKTKEVNGLLFEILEFAKNKYVVIVTGKDKLTGKEIEHITEVTKNVWKNGKFANVFREIGVKVVRQIQRKKQQATKYFPMVINGVKKITTTNYEDIVKQIEGIYSLKQLKKLYRKIANETHPDKGGNAKTFNIVTQAYENRKNIMKDAAYALGISEKDIDENDELWISVVDLSVSMGNFLQA